ncbi:hypothetical protein NOF04DRAFT_18454 [Fusarium oxysporum II5]|uniref:Transcription factor domain-containing protein n=2 Tax=Fusarium oxysporum species complex TaxID=171631 RepID=X0L6K2_FUSO5|nr:uncharacterized protein FOIG_04710 [Fusarium odoratissimum NRRL 54006]EXM04495.1 hypothetical protein FOIG_04710 [Fusarium odoratissimum NRRL 54006]KAK2126588.1 hypothetical protein NOF04DRAFT_18454 [Fusarium oxysporum II5]TXB99251.1 hypothetical protein FocTR4_00012433 [Fusarium oxysporum f. sp. cubense]
MVAPQGIVLPAEGGRFASNELVFRDETRNTVQKVLARRTASWLPSTPQFSPDTSSRNAFLSLYIDTYSCGFYTLQSLLTDSAPNGHLQVSVDAVSLAFMAYQLNRQDLVLLANQRYLAAIRSLGIVMRSSLQANNAANQSLTDETLQSVLLLDLYEKMAYQPHPVSEFPGSWLSHVQGALSIVRSRPTAGFSNPTTQQLATRTVIALTLSCGAAGIPIPEALIGLYNDLDSYVRSAKWTFIGLLISLINLRADMNNGKLDSSDIVQRARDLYEELSHAEGKIPRSWWPQRRDTSEAVVFGRYYDVYPGHYATQVFNAYRIMRLDVCSIIQKFDPSSEVAETITEVAQAICAAVPQFILPRARSQNTLPFSPLQILECSGVLTPLYAASQNTQDPVMRAWILQTLVYMADNGIKLARSVAQVIMFLPNMDYWAVFRMVGNCAITA